MTTEQRYKEALEKIADSKSPEGDGTYLVDKQGKETHVADIARDALAEPECSACHCQGDCVGHTTGGYLCEKHNPPPTLWKSMDTELSHAFCEENDLKRIVVFLKEKLGEKLKDLEQPPQQPEYLANEYQRGIKYGYILATNEFNAKIAELRKWLGL